MIRLTTAGLVVINAEIESLQFFDIAGYSLEPQQVPGVIMVMERLRKDKLID
jgi:hypothetical protein